jgi:hypothetical protein
MTAGRMNHPMIFLKGANLRLEPEHSCEEQGRISSIAPIFGPELQGLGEHVAKPVASDVLRLRRRPPPAACSLFRSPA